MDKKPTAPLRSNTLLDRANPHLQDVTLEKIRFGLRQEIGASVLHSLSIEQLPDFFSDRIVYALHGYMLGKQVWQSVESRTKIPASWWQHFKASVFPQWLLKRVPAKMVEIETVIKHYHICPHLNIVSEKDHLRFCMQVGDDCEISSSEV